MKNKKIRLRNSQQQKLSFKMRMIIGTSCILMLVIGIFITINISNVEKTIAGNNGDYRSVKNGEWEDAGIWEMYDGKKWHPATSSPIRIANSITVRSGIQLSVNSNITCGGLIVERGANLKLNTDFLTVNKESGSPVVLIYGTLDVGSCIINGNAKFNLTDNATLIIGNENGISKGGSTGAIQVTGQRYYSSFADYIYASSSSQLAGRGLPNEISSLTIENNAGVTLENDLTVISLLSIKKGTLHTGNTVLTLGSSAQRCGELMVGGGGIQGNFMRWLGASNFKDVEFPMMENKNRNSVFMSINKESFSGGTFLFSFYEGKPDKNAKGDNNTRVIAIGETGYYVLTAGNGLQNGIYKLQSTIALSKNENKNYWLVKGKTAEEKKGATKNEIDNFAFSDLSIGPNPFKETFKINFSLINATEVEINMMNATGQLVFKDKLIGNEMNNQYEYFNNQSLASGTYYVVVKANGKSVTKKIIKQ